MRLRSKPSGAIPALGRNLQQTGRKAKVTTLSPMATDSPWGCQSGHLALYEGPFTPLIVTVYSGISPGVAVYKLLVLASVILL